MTLLYYDPVFLEHDTAGHPESAERLVRITAHLRKTELAEQCTEVPVPDASLAQLSRVHSEAYVREIQDFSFHRSGYIEADTIVSRRSYDAAVKAAGAACDAVRRVIAGDDLQALCLVRPPGHHALPRRPMGFCLFNNVAIAARAAIEEHGLDRVLIVDWDVHHGNGTQDAFWEDPRVGFLSIHRWPFYPGTGGRSDTGGGQGLGSTVNLPVPFGISRTDYHRLFASALTQFADRFKPQLVLISAGFDSHRLDPIGSLGLEVEDFGTLTRVVAEVADVHAGGKLVSTLEGGYNVDQLPLCLAEHLQVLLDRTTAGDVAIS